MQRIIVVECRRIIERAIGGIDSVAINGIIRYSASFLLSFFPSSIINHQSSIINHQSSIINPVLAKIAEADNLAFSDLGLVDIVCLKRE
jgi:hypothetical protein